jgi:DNA-binding MarR family transcriptional regulator
LDDRLKRKIESAAEGIRSRANDPIVRAYTAFFLTYDILDNYVTNELGEHAVSRTGQNILHILVMNGGSMIATEISKQAWRSKFSITKVIDTLEKNGYVIRDNPDSEGDRRKKMISITEKGLELTTKIVRTSTHHLCNQVLRGLTPEQIDDLYQYLLHIGKNTFELINDSSNPYIFRMT